MDKKIQEIRTALAEATQEDETMTWIHADGEKAIEYITYLLQQIEMKDKELEFYADISTHTETMEEIQSNFSPKGIPSYRTNSAPIVFDKGERARAALKGEDTSE